MEQDELKVSGKYVANVSGKRVIVELRDILFSPEGRETYRVRNLHTGRELLFRSSFRFLEVVPDSVKVGQKSPLRSRMCRWNRCPRAAVLGGEFCQLHLSTMNKVSPPERSERRVCKTEGCGHATRMGDTLCPGCEGQEALKTLVFPPGTEL